MALQQSGTSTWSLFLLLVTLWGSRGNLKWCQAELSDASVLLAFKSQIQDPQAHLSDWNETPFAPCNWKGVGCYQNTLQVAQLNIPGMNLSGVISPVLGYLKMMQILNLAANNFSGSLPSELGLLQRLQSLNLGFNMLSGELPPYLGHLGSLQHLNLAFNNFTGNIPVSLGSLLNIKEILLPGNLLEGPVPPQIGNAAQLTTLNLSSNLLSGSIPYEVGNLKTLTILDFSMNELVGQIPSSLVTLPHLLELFLSQNQLTGRIPQQLGTFSYLSSLDLSSNFLNGPIPTNLCNLRNLSILSLSFNYLSGYLPAGLGGCQNLKGLNVSHNYLVGSLPPQIAVLPKLESLDLSFTGLSGMLDFENSGGALAELYLQSNEFTGILPQSLGLIRSLSKLDISYNMFSGDIPFQLGNCTRLTSLEMGHNNLSGPIPNEISNCKQLQTLNVSKNSLSGKIPMQIGTLETLQILDLSENKFDGTIPSQLGNLAHLMKLNLSNNMLSGPVPVNGEFAILDNIFLSGNSDLCGGRKVLGLKPCRSDKFSTSNAILIGVLVGLSIIVLVASVMWIGRRPITKFQDMKEENGACGNLETEGEQLRVFHQDGLQTVLEDEECQFGEPGPAREEYRALNLAPHDAHSPGASSDLSRNAQNLWPWKLTLLVPNLDLSAEEVFLTCLERNLMHRGPTGEMFTGVSKDGQYYVVEKSLRQTNRVNPEHIFRKLGQIRHPNIVKLVGYCLGLEENLVAIIFEDTVCENVARALRDGSLSIYPSEWTSRQQILVGTIRAVEYLHSQPDYGAQLHFEINSENILLDSNKKAHLTVRIDIFEFEAGTTSPKRSTSQAADNKNTDCTNGMDVYNLGVVLLQLLTGRPAVDLHGKHIVDWLEEALAMHTAFHDILDPNISKTTGALHQMQRMLKLVGACTHSRPEARPLLREVLEYL